MDTSASFLTTQFQLPKETLPYRKARDLGAYVWEAMIDRHLPGSRVLCGSRDLFMLGGYSYLGLIGHPLINAAVNRAIDELGTGTHGTSAMSGTSKYHKEMESRLATFWRRDDAILYPSGYAANLTVVNALTRHGDGLFIDIAAHMSLHDACSQSHAERVLVRHNDADDLDRKLARHGGLRNKIVIVDGAYSMDGDLCDLPALSSVCKRHNAFLLVDECHSFGMLPPLGGGVEEYYCMPSGTIDFRIGTLSKALPSHGGFVALSQSFADFVRHHGRHNIFSGSVPGAFLAGAAVALDLLIEHPEWVVELDRKSKLFREAARANGFETGNSVCAIVPIIIDDVDQCMGMAKACFDRGVFVQPVLFPAVKRSRLRAGINLAQSDADLLSAVDVLVLARAATKR